MTTSTGAPASGVAAVADGPVWHTLCGGLGVPRPPESSLRRLVFGREKLHHQGDELTPLRICQRFQNLLLNTVDDVVEFQELFDSSRGDGDDVTTSVLGVDRPLDEPA